MPAEDEDDSPGAKLVKKFGLSEEKYGNEREIECFTFGFDKSKLHLTQSFLCINPKTKLQKKREAVPYSNIVSVERKSKNLVVTCADSHEHKFSFPSTSLATNFELLLVILWKRSTGHEEDDIFNLAATALSSDDSKDKDKDSKKKRFSLFPHSRSLSSGSESPRTKPEPGIFGNNSGSGPGGGGGGDVSGNSGTAGGSRHHPLLGGDISHKGLVRIQPKEYLLKQFVLKKQSLEIKDIETSEETTSWKKIPYTDAVAITHMEKPFHLSFRCKNEELVFVVLESVPLIKNLKTRCGADFEINWDEASKAWSNREDVEKAVKSVNQVFTLKLGGPPPKRDKKPPTAAESASGSQIYSTPHTPPPPPVTTTEAPPQMVSILGGPPPGAKAIPLANGEIESPFKEENEQQSEEPVEPGKMMHRTAQRPRRKKNNTGGAASRRRPPRRPGKTLDSLTTLDTAEDDAEEGEQDANENDEEAETSEPSHVDDPPVVAEESSFQPSTLRPRRGPSQAPLITVDSSTNPAPAPDLIPIPLHLPAPPHPPPQQTTPNHGAPKQTTNSFLPPPPPQQASGFPPPPPPPQQSGAPSYKRPISAGGFPPPPPPQGSAFPPPPPPAVVTFPPPPPPVSAKPNSFSPTPPPPAPSGETARLLPPQQHQRSSSLEPKPTQPQPMRTPKWPPAPPQ